MTDVKISKSFSMAGWDFFVWLKGRKRGLVTSVGALLAYWITDQALVSIIAGLVVEAAFAVGDYFFSTIDLRE